MTTAHRPTWHNALGGENQGGNRLIPTQKVSSRDQPGNLTLKLRKPEQGPQTTNKKALLQQLEAKEKRAAAARRKTLSTLSALPAEQYVNPFPEDADDGDVRPAALQDSSSHRSGKDSSARDAGGERGAAGSSSEEDSDAESDEEQELLRELEKIKQERLEEERARRAAEEKKKEAEQKERMLRANPLLFDPESSSSGEPAAGAVKRRWDDEVVFKNQAKNLPKAKKQFINDPVRSEFHKKFLSKYIV